MAKKIAWSDQAKADVRSIDQQTAMRILHALARFTQTEEGNVKRLQDTEPPEYRLRRRLLYSLLRSPGHYRDSGCKAPLGSLSLRNRFGGGRRRRLGIARSCRTIRRGPLGLGWREQAYATGLLSK